MLDLLLRHTCGLAVLLLCPLSLTAAELHVAPAGSDANPGTVPETHDHGSFNSWGRDRYWSSDRSASQIAVDADPNLPFLDAFKTMGLLGTHRARQQPTSSGSVRNSKAWRAKSSQPTALGRKTAESP